MATQPISEVPEVEEHYLAQFAIVSGLVTAAQQLWDLLDPTNLAGTVEPVQRGLAALTQEYSRAAIAVAADHYVDLREQHVTGSFNVPVVDPIPEGSIRVTLTASADEAISRVRTVPDEVYVGEITAQMIREFEIAAGSAVADAGSDEIFAAMRADDRAKAWARVTRPGACYFCRMLASRGASYITRRSGSFRAHMPKNGRGGICRCTVEPLFGDYYEPTAQVREDRATWQRVVTDEGLKGADAIDAFRRAVEGREDGPQRRRRKRTRGSGSPGAKNGRPYFEQMTPAQLQHQLSVIEALKDSEYRTKQIERIRARLAELGA